MSAGTGGKYWQGKALPSVFKHELLKRYLPPFGGMTGTQSHDKRVVYLDGYAGEGRYENGESGSADIALKVASHHKRLGLNLSCFFVEQQPKSMQAVRAGDFARRAACLRVCESRRGGLIRARAALSCRARTASPCADRHPLDVRRGPAAACSAAGLLRLLGRADCPVLIHTCGTGTRGSGELDRACGASAVRDTMTSCSVRGRAPA
ncbi:three-Cys-motif partner protein TcmP [Streptomyces sp. NPDC050804]|uniref:three-Cys-motif partner protein TcmP n=1 Tax=Streptomyces sp. NPDC050804 TaxID=3154745 RepID=UPI0034302EE3